jgi:FkbM family methyltransferase
MDLSVKKYKYNFAVRTYRKILYKLGLSPDKPRIDFYGFSFELDLNQAGISRTIYTERIREIDHSTVFKKLIRNKMHCLDLGANIGYYMLFTLAHTSQKSKVLCIEPDARNIKVLTKNIKNNDLGSRVQVIKAAVSNNSGQVSMDITAASNLNKIRFDGGADQKQSQGSVSESVVQAVTLDEIYQQYGAFESLRMDIEGAESLIFQENSHKFLKEMPRGAVIFMEIHPEDYMPGLDYMRKALENIKNAGFCYFGLITSGKKPDDLIVKLLGDSKEVYKEGGFERHHYEGIGYEHWRDIALSIPKKARYIYCTK